MLEALAEGLWWTLLTKGRRWACSYQSRGSWPVRVSRGPAAGASGGRRRIRPAAVWMRRRGRRVAGNCHRRDSDKSHCRGLAP
jgi:hypothetical protein